MILGFKQKFADGIATNFKEKIYAGINMPAPAHGIKIHSIRAGKRWRKGNSIQMAYGVRTKQYKQFNKGKKYAQLQVCTCTQDVFMTYTHTLAITVSGRYLMPHEIDLLITNDGLTRQQFINWFFPGTADEFSGQIIHWTNFKY